jgi:hypothetical protein
MCPQHCLCCWLLVLPLLMFVGFKRCQIPCVHVELGL